MQRVMFDGPGKLHLDEVDDPGPPAAGAAIVRPLAVATCDLDVAALRGRYPLQGPYPFGHEGIARVTAIGGDVHDIAIGDLVVVPFQISCGSCKPCRRGRTGNCASHPPLSTYGLGPIGGLEWGGLLADLAVVPHADAMLVRVPDGIDPVTIASASDNIADAWRCVGPQLAAEPGGEVLVVAADTGPNSIGLYAAGLALALGASRVVYLDESEARCSVAERLGVEAVAGPPPRRAGRFPITVDASGMEAGLHCALHSTAFDGVCTSPSVYLDDPTVPMFAMYSRGCTLHTGRAHVRNAIPAIFAAMDAGFDPALVTSAVVDWDEALEALADPPMKLVITRAVDSTEE